MFPPLWAAVGYGLAWLCLPRIGAPQLRQFARRWRNARIGKRAWLVLCASNDVTMVAGLAFAYIHHWPLWAAVTVILAWLGMHNLLLFGAHPYVHRAYRLRRAWNRAAANKIGDPT